jgi:SAM-dependent MidA family methyltransferase
MIKFLQQSLSPGQTTLDLPAFLNCVLYHPVYGYYRRSARRVGRTDKSDFYTAASLGTVYAECILAAIRNLAPFPLSQLSFVELGPETEEGIARFFPKGIFAETRTCRPGEALDIPSTAVVFSNEVLDAQPFRRLVFQDGHWQEACVDVSGLSPEWTLEAPRAQLPPNLPKTVPEGYTVDWPSGAIELMEQIARLRWSGLFLAVDYGYETYTLFHERPRGTARTYRNHVIGNDLLSHLGQQDITCHIAWDTLHSILETHNFQPVSLQRQEAFFMNFAREAISPILEDPAPDRFRDRQTLAELLHPGNMGAKFQVLSGTRTLSD